MEELDVYNEDGSTTGKTVFRGCDDKDFLPGEHFAVSMVFIENSKGEFLIQKTPKGQFTSTGGHIHSGETPHEAIIRETKEELGIDISKDNLLSLGYRLLDFPLRFLYYLKKDIDIKDMVLEPSEVSDVMWLSINDIYKMIENNEMKRGHALLFKEIMKYKFNTPSLNDVFMKYRGKYDVKFPKRDYQYFELKLNTKNGKYKFVITDNGFQVFKKKKTQDEKYWDLINEYKNNNDYNGL